MRFDRSEFLDLVTFGGCEREMFCELFGPLVGLEEEWRAQGASEDEIALERFDFDYVAYVECGGNAGARNAGPPVTIREDAETRILRDHLGRTLKLCKRSATVPLPLDHPVACEDDWLRLKPLFEYDDSRIDRAAVERARALQSGGALVVGRIPGGWDLARELMGEEAACLAYYDRPGMIRDILETAGTTAVRVFERLTESLTIDQLYVHEDMAGKSGPLIGPAQVREFVAPYYRRVWDVLSSRGTRLFNLDSDGDLTPILDPLLEAGVNAIHPVEPVGGMDSVALRCKYGKRLALLGGIDKHVLRVGKDDIRRELEYRMQPIMRGGGTVFGLDHRIPNGTPLENYRFYVRLGRQMLGLPPADGTRRGWGRMGF